MSSSIGTNLRRKIGLQVLILFSVALFFGAHAQEAPRTLTVAAASDLQFALPELAAEFTRSTGTPVKFTLGSSGNLSAQVANGAPFDVLLSADASYPHSLVAAGSADVSTLTNYARGSLVLWFAPSVARKGAKLDLEFLADPSIQHLAIANPKHAPYGRAAEAALRSAHVWDKVQSKLVLGENISQTAQFVESGNAQAGLVALSLVQSGFSDSKGRLFTVPPALYPALDQVAVVTRVGAQNPASRKFVEFLRSKDAQETLQRYGFLPPSSESK